MRLYHGSNMAITDIDLSRCRPNKDFGLGFYLSPVKTAAEKNGTPNCKTLRRQSVCHGL